MSEGLADLVDVVLPRTCTVWTKTGDLVGGGSGSGWCYDSTHIVTNEHVVAGFDDTVKVRLPGQSEKMGRVVGVDTLTDLAVVEVDSVGVEPLQRRAVPVVRRGEYCMTLGSPLGEFNESVSLGIVSGVNRQIDMGTHKFEEAIQVDATINPGNSGGPLVDMQGRVIGVNFCSRNDAAQINFAIPTEVVNDVVPEILAFGAVERAGLGIAISAVPVTVKGVYRTAVEVQRAKEGSKLRKGDVILAINGVKVERRYDLMRTLNRRVIGASVTLHVFRGGEVVEVTETAVRR
jgi:S1-C subfamily serine protease